MVPQNYQSLDDGYPVKIKRGFFFHGNLNVLTVESSERSLQVLCVPTIRPPTFRDPESHERVDDRDTHDGESLSHAGRRVRARLSRLIIKTSRCRARVFDGLAIATVITAMSRYTRVLRIAVKPLPDNACTPADTQYVQSD